MSTLTPDAAIGLDRYGVDRLPETERRTELGQDAFLKLMLTQLKHQDPLAPMENGEFLGQMAQFSTVSGIEKMHESIEGLVGAYGSSQTLQASSLVGREIVIEDDKLVVDGSDTTRRGGRFELDAGSGSVELDILDARGSLVRRVPLGQRAAGMHEFSWDGLDEDGRPLAPGTYTASVTADGGEESVALTVFVTRRVESVEFAPGGIVRLNTPDGGRYTLDDIRQIGERPAS